MRRFTALHSAAQRGDKERTQQLLNEGGDPGEKDAEGRTPLHHAVMRGHLAVVQLLLESGPPSLLLSTDVLGCTPVHLAAVQNQVNLILTLVAALLRDEAGTTPLHEIARRRCMQDFMGFLHLGWDVAAQEEGPLDGKQDEPPSPALAALAEEVDLQRPGMRVVCSVMCWGPLHIAAMEGRVPLIRRLVTELGCSLTERAANSWTPLHYAAAHNRVGAIEELVRLGCAVDVKDSVASTPMHVAAGEGHLEAILLLVQLGCAAAVKDRDGCTPLYCAAAWNQVEAVRQLDRLGCPSWQKSLEGRTPVHVAAEQGWVELIALLIQELRNKVDSRDSYQFTPLHSAANGGHVATIQKLIAFGHQVDVKDYLGRTPLHYAAMHGRVAALTELARHGVGLECRDIRGGYTPLHLAADAGQCDAVARLVELGASLEAESTKGWTPLGLATFKGPANVDAVATLIELGANFQAVLANPALESPLHIAARCGRLDVVERLLRCKVPIDVRAKDGSSPLHYAAAFGQVHVVRPLVAAGCPVDCRDDASNTPLHLAAGCGFLETVELLAKLGAALDARDIMACTPLQNAAHGTYSALAAMPSTSQPSGSSKGQQPVAQSAAQLALSTGTTARNGKVPVRTGLAWASLGLTGSGLDWGLGLLGPTAEAEASAGLMHLIKRASKRRDTAASQEEGKHAKSAADGGLEALLKRSEALRAGGLEQDRRRLLAVARRLVELGAEVDARDAEGRTALHLAAGCGDAAMVLLLVQLGSHVDARDSVGGTPMHHAAMANKKEMMFELARLGCDWRAKADGIDGATAAFVLCGQHGKTTRQQRQALLLAQKLVEAKLKRVYQEGAAARAQGQQAPSLQDLDLAAEEGDADAVADANMAALLQQVQLEDAGRDSQMARKKRKKRRSTKGRAAPEDRTSEGMSEDDSAAAGDTISRRLDQAEDASPASREPVEQAEPSAPPESNTTSAQPTPAASESGQPEQEGPADDAQVQARRNLEEAASEALDALERWREQPRGGDAGLAAAAERLEAAIVTATEAGVSAKYGKKVLRRLRAGLEESSVPPPKPRTPQPTPSQRLLPGEWRQDGESGDDAAEEQTPSAPPHPLPPAHDVPLQRGEPAPAVYEAGMDRGQRVEKPAAAAGISRTPKRTAVASEAPQPLGSLNHQPAAPQRQVPTVGMQREHRASRLGPPPLHVRQLPDEFPAGPSALLEHQQQVSWVRAGRPQSTWHEAPPFVPASARQEAELRPHQPAAPPLWAPQRLPEHSTAPQRLPEPSASRAAPLAPLTQVWPDHLRGLPEGSAAAAAFSAFAAAPPDHSSGFLDPWASAPRLASLATPGSQIWQSQPLPGTSLPATWQSTPPGGTQAAAEADFSSGMDHTLGGEVAASVLAVDEQRLGLRGYGQLW